MVTVKAFALHVSAKGRCLDFDRAHRVALQHIEVVDPWVEEHKSFVEQKFIDLGRPRKGRRNKRAQLQLHGLVEKKFHGLQSTPSMEDEKLILHCHRAPGTT